MKEFTLKLLERDLEVVFMGLDNMKRKVSNPVFTKLAKQVQEQVKLSLDNDDKKSDKINEGKRGNKKNGKD